MLVWEEDMVKALRKERESLREENARLAALVQQYHPAYLGLPHVVRERNEARAEVKRLEGLILYWGEHSISRHLPGLADEARRIRAKREKGEARTTCRHGVQWPDFCQFNCAIGKPAQREKEK